MHLVKRHALHVVRVFLFIVHLLFFLHSGIVWDLLQARPKNDCNERKDDKIKTLKNRIEIKEILYLRQNRQVRMQMEWRLANKQRGK